MRLQRGRLLRASTWALAAGIVLGATGCAGQPGAADHSYRGVVASPSVTPHSSPDPSTTAVPAPPPGLGTPLAAWVEKPRRFGVTLWGSSSCPAVPTRMEATAPDRVSISFEQAGEKACTADLAPMTYEFKVPAGADTVPLTVILRRRPGRDHTHIRAGMTTGGAAGAGKQGPVRSRRPRLVS